jgi:glycosyltransferase involved in cell wall biosynthesis
MGPALGTILRLVKKNRYTRVICIADNVKPHEKRPGDKIFTRYFLKSCDGFVTMSEKVRKDLFEFETNKPVQLIQHPLYDNFGDIMSKGEARKQLGLSPGDKIILFFGFIRQYKGLDLLLKAMADKEIRRQEIKLMVAGEFYEDAKQYLDLVSEYNLQDQVILKTNFIPDSEVKFYLCAADCVVQPYRNATQSGVTPLAYHFEKPMIVTNVGGLPSLVPDKKVGLIAEPNAQNIAEKIIEYFTLGEEFFLPYLREEKKKYTWKVMTEAILNIVSKSRI